MAKLKYLAFDLGASGGRAIVGSLERDQLSLEEMHRFANHPVQVFDHFYWDVLRLFQEMKDGLAITAQRGHKKLAGIGVDTWGVDFGFVGRDQVLLGNPYTYRDKRTDGMMEKAFSLMAREKIYQISGIQFMQFNSIFQFLSMVESSHPIIAASEKLLFMPDLFHFLMTGEKLSEYTIASTSQLLNAAKRTWEPELFAELSLPIDIMAPIVQPGTIVGKMLPSLCSEIGLDSVDVIAPASHDTASAVAAVPAHGSDWAYLSSGTWSLIGIETSQPIINEDSLQNDFTNEGGVNNTIRFLRNVMGLWLLQGCMNAWQRSGEAKSYDEILHAAATVAPFKCIVEPDDPGFLNPPDMPAAIVDFCARSNQPAPENPGELVRCILESLALKYRYVIDKITTMSPVKLKTLHIVGGGSQNQVLNQFTANATGLAIVAGPVEATAIGNILVQAMAKKELASLEQGRELVARSFPLQSFEPQETSRWNEAYEKYRHLFC